MSLSSLIVQREIASIREIEEALARQVLYGGDLVTNLLEVSRIEEAALMPIVAESFGLPSAPLGELPKPPDGATRLVAAEVALERGFAPLEVGGSLIVAVAEPLARDVEQELTFALALPIEQRIAPLFRIRQALARDYGVRLDKRTARLITKVVHRGPRIASTFPPPLDSNPAHRAPPRPPSAGPPPPVTSSGATPRAATNQGTLVREMEVPPARPVRRRRGPLPADAARAELEAAVERDVIFDVLFEFARQFFDYTALFIVHGDIAEGCDAFGDGASRDKVARIGVPLDLGSILQSARQQKKLVRAAPAKEGLDPVLMADLARRGDTECVVFPIVVRSRVVALLFGDGGLSGIDDIGVAQVERLIENASGAFERVIMRRKLKGEAGVERAPAKKKASDSAPPPPTQLSAVEPTQDLGQRPSVEELAPPIRDLFVEPPSRVVATPRQPVAAVVAASIEPPSTTRSDQPPPEKLLAVRRPSGRPIPREEPEAAQPSAAAKGATAATSVGPPRTKSGSLSRRAEAPALEFGRPSIPSVVAEGTFGVPQSFLDGAALSSDAFGQGPLSPKAESPMALRAAPVTDVSPRLAISPSSLPPPPPPDVRPEPVIPKVRLDADPRRIPTLVAGQSPLYSPPPPSENRSPVTPLVVVTPDREMTPLSLPDLDATPIAPPVFDPDDQETPLAGAVDVVLALSQRKGAPPPLPASDPKPMPVSEQQVSVPAHKPPSSRSDATRVLPSIIVDVASEYVDLVERVLAGPDDDAETSLLRAGAYAMPAIMARFPGPIAIESERLESGRLPRVAECGPVIRLIASQRRTALPSVLEQIEAAEVESRFWATYLLTELVYPDAIDAAIARVFDEDARVRRAARAATRALAEAHPQPVIERLGEIAGSKSTSRRVQAIEALGETREAAAVTLLVAMVEDSSEAVASAVRAALVMITRQDFAFDPRRWQGWWEQNKARHRLEWLIDALMSDHRALRAAASEELKTTTKEYFGYYDDLPKRERERAQARYREWWENAGRVRFNRAATRGA